MNLLLENQVDEPFAALAFKIATDPFVGRLCFTRAYQWCLRIRFLCVKHKNMKERAYFTYLSNARKQTKSNTAIQAGDIAALLDLKILEQEIRYVLKMHLSS